MSNKIKWIVIFLLLIALSLLAIIYITLNAYLYASFLWICVLGWFAWSEKVEKRRLIAIYFGSGFVAFFLAELYFSGIFGVNYDYIDYELNVVQGELQADHELLGWAPAANSRWNLKLIHGDSVSFDVVHTTDSTRFRTTPGDVSEARDAVLFLGCSYTFGAGVNDDETLPYFYQNATSGNSRAINMAHNGYGAHQMMAILEHELEAELLGQQTPRAAVYSAITDHVFRGTGARFWENFGPRYRLDENGNIVYKGLIPNYTSFLNHYLEKSHLLVRYLFRKKASEPEEIDLFVALVSKSRTLFTERYGAPFYCLLWKEVYSEPGLYEKLQERLKAESINVLEVNDILTEHNKDPWKYLLYENAHPNGMTNQLLADYLIEKVIPSGGE